MQPTRTRYTIVLLALLINLVCYTDRSCVSIAGPKMREEFGFTQIQMGLVYSIFSLSYFLGQTPWGILSDRYGARWLVALAIAGWSTFTGMTALAWSFLSLLSIRFVFGGLEAALSPAIATAFNRWIPERERASAFGFFLGGGRLGAAITPSIAAVILTGFGWRTMFLAFGALGLVAALGWMLWFRNTPAEHPGVNEAELRLIADRSVGGKTEPLHRPEWGDLLRSDRFWSLLAVSFGCTFMWQFYITWFPTYLREKLHMTLQESAVYAGLPFLLGVFGTWLGGLLTDGLSRRYEVRQARTVVGACSLTMGGILLSAGIWCTEPRLAAVLMAGGALGVDLFLGAAWASAVEIGGAKGGAVAGAMNAASNFAGFLSPTFNGWVLETFHDWNVFLMVAVAVNLVAAALWLRVNPRRIAAVAALVVCVSLHAEKKPLVFDIQWVNPPDKQVTGLTHHTLTSKSMGHAVGFNVYLPPGYDKSIDRYPVLYWLHGATGHESSRVMIAEQFHRAIEAKIIPPAILVIPNGGKRSEYRDWEPQRVMMETFLIRELIPHIDATYRTIASRNGRHIEGMSMGGNGALKLAFKYPQMFGSVVAYAGSYGPLPLDAKSEWVRQLAQWYSADDDVFVLAKRNRDALQDMRIRLVIGTKDVSWADSEKLHAALQEYGIAHEYEALLGVEHDNTVYYQRAGERGFAFHSMVATRAEAIPYRDKLRLLMVKPEGWQARDQRPAVMWIHGGGWTGGEAERFLPQAAYYARKGAVGFSVQYRLAKPPLAIEDAVDDVRAAVRYVRDHAPELGVDSKRIVVAGDSAGGHLALMTATEKPAAIIDCNGIADVTNPKWAARARDARAVSPLFQIGSGHPPVLILHGLADTVVLPAEAERLHAALQAAGVRSKLVTWPEAKHAFVVAGYQASTEVVLRALREVDLFTDLR